MHDPWVSHCFSFVWALVFKLPSPFISPFTFPNLLIHCSESLLLRLFLQLFQLCSGDFPLPICAALFRGMFLFSLSFFFSLVICCKFIIYPSFPFFFFFCHCDCFCFLAFGVLVFTSLFLHFFWVSMVSSFEFRIACPSISVLFARAGGSLGVFPKVEDFVF